MKAELLEKLCCPARECNSRDLVLDAARTDTLEYRSGRVEEVREGAIVCRSCGRSYPITEYVPSFDQLFSPDLRQEADYWSKWYRFMWDRGYLGYFDLRAPMAPLITEGIEVLDPSSLDREDRGGTHSMLADHPLIKGAGSILDVGCGTGWSSLYLARRGHSVVAFDPSSDNMRLAKRYAISQGEYIEYLGAALGYLAFKPGVFDAVFALHSIHHVPDLPAEMPLLRSWLREGGAIALDEHIRNNPLLQMIAQQIHVWAQEEVYPRVRSLGQEELEGLPQTAASTLEDAGSEQVIEAILANFVPESLQARYVSLDFFSFIYYLSRDLNVLLFSEQGLDASHGPLVGASATPMLDARAYHYGADVIQSFYRLLSKASPGAAEYVTIIARKVDATGSQPNALALRAASLGKEKVAWAEAPEYSLPLLRAEKALTSRRLVTTEEELTASNIDRAALRAETASLAKEIERLSSIIEVKNRHIENLETLVRTKQSMIEGGPLRLAYRGMQERRAVSRILRMLHGPARRSDEKKRKQ